MKNEKWKRECPNCTQNIFYVNIGNYNRANKINCVCKKCVGLIKRRKQPYSKYYNKISNLWERECPNCKRILKYKNIYNLLEQEKNNKLCRVCVNKKETVMENVIMKFCPECKKIINFKNKYICKGSMMKKSVCRSCSKKGYRNPSTFLENRKKSRIRIINWVQENKNNGNQIHPWFNNNACSIIDEYGKENGYNFQHAMNGGELYLNKVGCWPDGVDEKRKTIIEIDEEHHFDKNGNLKQKDLIREQLIIKEYNYKIIRIKFSNKQVYRIIN